MLDLGPQPLSLAINEVVWVIFNDFFLFVITHIVFSVHKLLWCLRDTNTPKAQNWTRPLSLVQYLAFSTWFELNSTRTPGVLKRYVVWLYTITILQVCFYKMSRNVTLLSIQVENFGVKIMEDSQYITVTGNFILEINLMTQWLELEISLLLIVMVIISTQSTFARFGESDQQRIKRSIRRSMSWEAEKEDQNRP